MPHERSRWRDKIRSVGLEYLAVRVSVDWLLAADVDEIHRIAGEGGNENPHRGAMYAAHENLGATYFIRLFSMFEMAAKSYWLSLPGNAGRSLEIDGIIDEIGINLRIGFDLIYDVQRVRRLRNDLVHEWRRPQVVTVDVAGDMNRLVQFVDSLPLRWS
jgi:hypothetical protein